MPLLFATVLAAAAAQVPVCSWDRPGADPFMGDVVAAVDHYGDLPPATRAALKRRMAARQYDDVAVIRRDSIAGKHRYDAAIAGMHFGGGRVCASVTRAKWAPTAEERGLVYCEGEHCIIVPTVCRNVSRVTRVAPQRADAGPEPEAAPAAAPGGGAPQRLASTAGDAGADPTGEVTFDPPGAGPSFEQASDPAASPLPGGGSLPGGSGGGPGPTAPGPVFGGWIGSPGPGGSVPLPLDPRTPTEIGAIVTPAVPLLPPPTLPIPEPGTLALWLAGLCGIAAATARRRRRDGRDAAT